MEKYEGKAIALYPRSFYLLNSANSMFINLDLWHTFHLHTNAPPTPHPHPPLPSPRRPSRPTAQPISVLFMRGAFSWNDLRYSGGFDFYIRIYFETITFYARYFQ
jgi:hypothetical protein